MKKRSAFIWKHKVFSVLLLLAFLILLIVIFPEILTSKDPNAAVMMDALQAPSRAHPFGTDKLGRDLFARVVYGARTSVPTAFLLVFLIFSIGSFLGIIAGYFGGFIDALIMRIADIMIAFPGLVLAMAIVGILGPNLMNAVLAIAAVSWPKYARLARSLVLKIRQRDYVAAAVLTGSRTGYILRRYMFRLSLPTLIVTAATDIGKMMLEMAALSFLGFGAQPPTPEWGLMLNEGRSYLQIAPWLMIYPGLAMFLVVSVFNLIGDSLRDLLDTTQEE